MVSNKTTLDLSTFHNIINNTPTATATTRHAINPTTEKPLPEAPLSTQSDVDTAVSAATAAFPSWRALTPDDRASYLLQLASALEANASEFTTLLGLEVGKPVQAAATEVAIAIGHLRGTAALRLEEEILDSNDERTATLRHVPIGVGLAITPWNFPLLLAIGKLGPALLAGNTIILKPSPYAPYSALKLAELAGKILPPGVLQALSGDETLGPLLTAHPGIGKVSFTGSSATGKKVMAACAATLKRVTLELGGNDAAVVCGDVDVDAVVAKVGILAFLNSGQICMNVKRLFVHEDVYGEFMGKLVGFVKHLKTGGAGDETAFSGPVQNGMQYDKVRGLYEDVVRQGLDIKLGGLGERGVGYFMPLTIVDNPPDDSRVVVEEPFGPILPVLKWSDEADVIKRANGSLMGLGASVWTRDLERGERIARQLEAGSVWVNTHFELAPNVPFGGHKWSGIGVDWGVEGLKGWCNPQTVWVRKVLG
ncbi:hypothetical protein OQA88_11537 [Cercophora sp. LCS_1]